MNPLNVVLIVVVAAAYPVGMAIARNACLGRLTGMLGEGCYDEALAFLDGKGVRFLFSPYNVGVMRLNTCQMAGDVRGAERELEGLRGVRANGAQRADLAERTFRFWLEQGRTGRAKKALAQVRESCDAPTTERCQRLWEIFSEGSSAYIDEMSAAYEGAHGPERAQLALLVANQYANRHDARQAAAWRAKAQA